MNGAYNPDHFTYSGMNQAKKSLKSWEVTRVVDSGLGKDWQPTRDYTGVGMQATVGYHPISGYVPKPAQNYSA